jgi:hypothetical protein
MSSSSLYGGANCVAAVYGPSGAGKTVDMLYSFPRGLFIAPPGALKPAYNVVGFVPAATEVSTIMEATELLKKHAKSGEYDAIIADDFSLLAEQTVAVLEKKHSGFTLWGKVRDAVLEFRDTARHVGMHVVLTAHESAPKTTNGAFVRGGPKLPGKLPEDVPGVCDIVLRAAADPSRRGWHGCYRCTPDEVSWVTKDRHGVTPDRAPMNLAEILRLAGYTLRRAPGLEWQDEVVAGLAEALLGATGPGQDKALLAAWSQELQAAGHHDLHIRWTLRDALDRVALTRAKANVLGMYL